MLAGFPFSQDSFSFECLCERVESITKQVLNGTLKDFGVVTLVGSTRFHDVWAEAQRVLTMKGAIVHTVGLFGHQEKIDMHGPLKRLLDKIYLQKIQKSDFILVLNKNGYIGMGAWDEIFYTIAQRSAGIFFLEPLTEECFRNFVGLYFIELK